MKRSIMFLLIMVFIYSACAYAFEQSELVGYTLIAEKTVEDEFEGCEFDKKIKFMDGTHLTCATYSYTYDYMPTAYIYAKRFEYKGDAFYDIKMVVEDEIYDMRPILIRK